MTVVDIASSYLIDTYLYYFETRKNVSVMKTGPGLPGWDVGVRSLPEDPFLLCQVLVTAVHVALLLPVTSTIDDATRRWSTVMSCISR